MSRMKIFIIIVFIAGTPVFSEEVPGVVINYRPASARIYLGSPGIAILPNGDYVVSQDFFDPGAGAEPHRPVLFGSKDKGKTWWNF